MTAPDPVAPVAMTVEHTPGPWLIGNSNEDRSDCIGIQASGDSSYTIADVWADVPALAAVAQANAALIASAPALLEALAVLVMQRDAHFHTTDAWDKARAALAAARGAQVVA